MQTPALTNAAIFAPQWPRPSSFHCGNCRFSYREARRGSNRRAADTACGRAALALARRPGPRHCSTTRGAPEIRKSYLNILVHGVVRDFCRPLRERGFVQTWHGQRAWTLRSDTGVILASEPMRPAPKCWRSTTISPPPRKRSQWHDGRVPNVFPSKRTLPTRPLSRRWSRRHGDAGAHRHPPLQCRYEYRWRGRAA